MEKGLLDHFDYRRSCMPGNRDLQSGVPLDGPSMYAALGLGWGNTLLGLLYVLFIPIPIALYRYGKVIRERYLVGL